MFSPDSIQPMRLVRIHEPFDDPEFVWELKHDGFRALAFIENGHCRLVSRRCHLFKQFGPLADALANVPVKRAIIDGEVACLDKDGRSHFTSLLFRRQEPCFVAFDLLWLGARDLTSQPLLKRKDELAALVARADVPRLLYDGYVESQGIALFKQVCALDLEGIVGKWSMGTYLTDGRRTSWVKVKNAAYSQVEGRRELFEGRRSVAGQAARR